MRALIADKLSPIVSGHLQDLGVTPTMNPTLSGEALKGALAELDPEILVVRSTRVNADQVAAAPSLALVVRAGAGVNTIDADALSARGIYLANCPGKNAAAVAELTLGHLINLDRRIADNVQALREGRWMKKAFGKARGLRGRRLAVLGCGQVGRAVVRHAQSLGMEGVAWSRSLTPAQADVLGVAFARTPEDAARGADALTIHLALGPETRRRVGKSVLDQLNPGAYVVNTSRAEVLDHEALLEAIQQRGVRAGLDVFEDEPTAGEGDFDGALSKLPSIYGTHHIGASTEEATDAVGREVVRIVAAYRDGQPIPNCVNLQPESQASHVLVVRHEDRVGVLAQVLDVLREAGHNVQEMNNIVFCGSSAACARISVQGDPSEETLTRLRSLEAIFAASAVRT